MLISDIVKHASLKVNASLYAGDEVLPLSCRVSYAMMRDLDAISEYSGISRSDAIRSVLAEVLPRVIEQCQTQGPNAQGVTIEQCNRIYLEELPEDEQAEIRRHMEAL